MKKLVEIKNVSKVYRLYRNKGDRLKEAFSFTGKKYHREFKAIDDVSLEINKGDFLGIVGRNGAGKSTLLKLISKVIIPTSGEIKNYGKVVPILELGSGFNPEFTGKENIYFYSSLLGYSTSKTNQLIDEIIEFADIGSFINQPLKIYSSGMKARLAFSVAAHIESEILILDEVLSVGDELFRRKSFARMEKYFSEGNTIIFVSHNAESINQLCNRAILIDKGRIILDDEPKHVTMKYQKFLFSNNKELSGLDEDKVAKKAQLRIVEQSKKKEVVKPDSYFIPKFIPKSTVITKNFDVDISNICIRNEIGNKVNVLVSGEFYELYFEVKSNLELSNLEMGMDVKTEKGVLISSVNSNRICHKLYNIKPKESFLVKWRFECAMIAGNYYINVAVGTFQDQERNIVIKIDDALVFKVLDLPYKKRFGLVNLKQSIVVKKNN